MLPRLICAATLGLSMLTRVQAVCRAVPYLTRFGSAAASASEVINYLPTDSSRESARWDDEWGDRQLHLLIISALL